MDRKTESERDRFPEAGCVRCNHEIVLNLKCFCKENQSFIINKVKEHLLFVSLLQVCKSHVVESVLQHRLVTTYWLALFYFVKHSAWLWRSTFSNLTNTGGISRILHLIRSDIISSWFMIQTRITTRWPAVKRHTLVISFK